mmetsp:Transcript_23416/g.59740  ORF Transcript_23416/g.59740 Transcript_23416/m.59740 type:complete len:200 (+) Transcript_23416:322-921(+)
MDVRQRQRLDEALTGESAEQAVGTPRGRHRLGLLHSWARRQPLCGYAVALAPRWRDCRRCDCLHLRLLCLAPPIFPSLAPMASGRHAARVGKAVETEPIARYGREPALPEECFSAVRAHRCLLPSFRLWQCVWGPRCADKYSLTTHTLTHRVPTSIRIATGDRPRGLGCYRTAFYSKGARSLQDPVLRTSIQFYLLSIA